MKTLYKTNILVVDDNEDNLDLIDDMLDDEGYKNIICVLSAKKAYEELEKNSIDLIILDIMMPEINGIEACQYIKSDERYKDIPIIIVTAKSDLKTLQEGFDAGANDYIKKPITTEIELVSRVKNSLNLKLYMDKYKELNQNLDQRVKKEIEKNREKEQLLMYQSKMASMGEMMENIAHQWRQPLTNLGLTVEKIKILYMFGELDKDHIEDITGMSLKLIHQMSSTISDFTGFFQPNKSKEIFNIKTTINETVTLVNASLDSYAIELEIKDEAEEIILNGYKGEFSQVILNLLSNAKDVLAEKKIKKPKIEIDISSDEDFIFIKVQDNGGGVPPKIINKVFQPYFTTKSRNKGTGIGLYMSKMIIEKSMNSTIWVENISAGACFTIKLKKG